MSNEHKDLYEFGEFVLDPRERVLHRNGQTLDLPPKVFDTLLTLVEECDRVLSKDELMERIWGETVVEESNLTQNIYSIRQVLGRKNKFIKTLPRRGYRFAATVRRRERTESGPISSADEKQGRSVKSYALSRKSWLIAGSALAIAIMAALGIWTWLSQRQVPNTSSQDRILFERLTSSGDAFSPAISPDGKLLAYTRGGAGDRRLFLKDIDSGNDVELQVSNGLTPEFLQFAPDGSKLFFRPRGRLGGPQRVYEISYFGGEATAVADNVWGLFSLSPDGSTIAFYRSVPDRNEQHLILRDLKSGTERQITRRVLPDQFLHIIYPAWSTDGKTLAYVPVGDQANRSAIHFVDVASGSERSIETGLTYVRQIAFLPDNRSLLLVAREKEFQIFRFDYVSGEARRVTNDPNNYRHLAISSDGQRMITQQRKLSADIWLYPDGDLGRGRALTEGGHYGLYDLAFTRTGSVVFDAKGKISRDLRILDPATGTAGVLSRDENTNNHHGPESDGDGNIYFVSDESGRLNIWRVRPDGSKREAVTFSSDGISVAPALSPDGVWLYFIQKTSMENSIWRKAVAGGELERVFSSPDLALGRFTSVSPDGRWLAFQFEKAALNNESTEDEEPQMTNFGFLNLNDPGIVQTVEVRSGRRVLRWANGGRSFDYNQNGDFEGTIRRLAVANPRGESETVFRLPDARIIHFAWSPDGKSLAITKGSNQSDIVMLELPG